MVVRLLSLSFIVVLFSGSTSFISSQQVSNQKTLEAFRFCKQQKLDTAFAIFVDMSLPSGKFRLFVLNLQSQKVVCQSLCCHGMGGTSSEEKIDFSNVPGSNCTSLGKYKTGARAFSQYGIHVHYKLHGLELTNNKAFDRIVVLHSYSPVPETEIYPSHLPMGWSLGCPVVSNNTMTFLDNLLKKRSRPLLLWIYK
jgi:hypothetical protein